MTGRPVVSSVSYVEHHLVGMSHTARRSVIPKRLLRRPSTTSFAPERAMHDMTTFDEMR
jgi:hypothetical protein